MPTDIPLDLDRLPNTWVMTGTQSNLTHPKICRGACNYFLKNFFQICTVWAVQVQGQVFRAHCLWRQQYLNEMYLRDSQGQMPSANLSSVGLTVWPTIHPLMQGHVYYIDFMRGPQNPQFNLLNQSTIPFSQILTTSLVGPFYGQFFNFKISGQLHLPLFSYHGLKIKNSPPTFFACTPASEKK